MRGQRKLAEISRMLRDVTPATVTVRSGDVVVTFGERNNIKIGLPKQQGQYLHRDTYYRSGSSFDVPSEKQRRHWRNYASDGSYQGPTGKVLSDVGQHVRTVISQTRQAYIRVLASLNPELGLKILDGEKPEDTLMDFVRDILEKLPAHLPGLPSGISLSVQYLPFTFSNVYQWTVGPRKQDGTLHITLAQAVEIIKDIQKLLQWFIGLQDMVRVMVRRAP